MKTNVKKITKSQTRPKASLDLISMTEASRKRVRVGHQDFIRGLTEKLTLFDATLILEAAIRSAGVDKDGGYFGKRETKDICLQLIKRGGPAFAVGAKIYREVVGIENLS